MSKIIEKIKYLFSGQFSKTFLWLIWIPLMVTVFLSFLLVSMNLCQDYHWTIFDISYLGVTYENPEGWIYWAIGMVLTGVLMLPVVPYIYHRLALIDAKLTKIGCGFLYLSAIGLFFLGLLPQNGNPVLEDIIHPMNGGFAFGGLFIGMFILEKPILKNKAIKKPLVILMLIFLWGGPIGFLVSQGISFGLDGIIDNSGPWYLHFSTWEWMLLYSVFAVFLLSALILPKNGNNPENLIK